MGNKNENKLDPRLHFVVATAIIHRKRKDKTREYLILKRAAHEKAFPNRWTVPGGKLVLHEYEKLPKTTISQWYNVVDWVLKKEVKEEANLEIHQPEYLCDLTFVRPDGYPVVTLSYFAKYKKGIAKPGKDLTDHAWVTLKEAKKYDLIEGIWNEIREVEKILKKKP
jgi:8-oxo-dGTP pyrophosphatase MutT (NUDIX family)